MASRTLVKIKTESTFNKDLTYLVDVMKSIAGTQYHIMERKRTDMVNHKTVMDEFFQVYDFRYMKHPFLRSANKKKLIVVITTDFGFLGGLNMKVVQAAQKQFEAGSHFLVLGERGANYMREYGLPFTPFPGINPDETRFELVRKTQQEIFRVLLKNGYGQALLVFPYSVSMTAQKVQVMNLIPCPMFFKEKPEQILTDLDQTKDVILESPEKYLIEYLTAIWMQGRLIDAFENAKLSEYGARMMHLEDSFNTLTKIDKQLRLEFFKARREKIDQSLRETATAQLLLGSQEKAKAEAKL